MSLHKAYGQYKENSVYTARPEELTLMLYNGLVKFIMQAQMAIDEKKLDRANNCIIRAQDIVYELQSTLNKKYEISQSLWMIYDYMIRRLRDANLKKDKGILEEVLGFAKELRDAWEQGMKLARHQQHSSHAGCKVGEML